MKKFSSSLLFGALLSLGLLGIILSQSTSTQAAGLRYAVTTSKVKVGTGVLPKGTRVVVTSTTFKNKVRFARIAERRLSYQLRRQIGNKGSFLVPTTRLKYVAVKAGDALPTLHKGKNYNKKTMLRPSLTVTTDNYLEYYKTGNLNLKPVSVTHLTATRSKGQYTYLYAKTNMLKLPDKRIHKSGNYQYRLTIRNNKRAKTNSMSYSVGRLNNYFLQIIPSH